MLASGAEPTRTLGDPMTIRRWLVLMGCAALSLTVPWANASPFVGQYQYAEVAEYDYIGHDGALWQLTVRATAVTSIQSRPEQRLYLILERCLKGKCAEQGRWSQPLTADEIRFSDAYTEGILSTRVGSTALSLVLYATVVNARDNPYGGSGGAFSGVGLDDSPPGVSPDFYRYHPAFGAIRVGAVACQVHQARLGEWTSVDTTGDDARFATPTPVSLPKGFLGSRTRCAEPRSRI